MCSLVAYGSSDESEEESLDEKFIASASEELNNVNQDEEKCSELEEEADESSVSVTQIGTVEVTNQPPALGCDTSDVEKTSETRLFSSLPEPKQSGTILDPENSFLTSSNKTVQKKQTVKISIPSLSEFEDQEEEPRKKKLKPSTKGSGLFSLLPAPKNVSTKEANRPLVPHVLTKKPDSLPTSKSALSSANGLKKSVKSALAPSTEAADKKSSALISYADSEEESDGESDFFSLNKDSVAADTTGVVVEPQPVTQEFENYSSSLVDGKESTNATADEPLTFSDKFNPSPWSSSASGAPTAVENRVDQGGVQVSADSNYISVQQEELQLNEEALQRLCGRRAKRQHQEMQLVEVSGDAIMPDPKEWLTKQLTQEQERRSHSHRKNDGPTTQQRRKHQITYLAFQAKENEMELKNQWSQNRMSRKQTQSKYGF